MKRYTFNDDEMTAMMMALVGRRNTIKDLIVGLPEAKIGKNVIDSYVQEKQTVEGLLEKFFPGSVSRLPT
jgi:hypothetical protein